MDSKQDNTTCIMQDDESTNSVNKESDDGECDEFVDCCNSEESESCVDDSGVMTSQTDESHFSQEENSSEVCEESKEEHYESAEEEHLTSEEAEERKIEAMELKTQGNEHFRKQEYVEAMDVYTRAIKKCPKAFPENKSVFYANRAACSQKMEEYENAISDCSKALELVASYNKARLRRAQCYEKIEKLEEALEDYKIVFENDKSCQTAREAIIRLPEEIKIKHEKLKEEMIAHRQNDERNFVTEAFLKKYISRAGCLHIFKVSSKEGKLKDLGNMVLRPFGLSTDNFKLQQDPGTGGYSINFQK